MILEVFLAVRRASGGREARTAAPRTRAKGARRHGRGQDERRGMTNRIRLATIGTSPISDNLLEAAREVSDVEYVGTLSRDAGRARAFTEAHGGTRPFTSLEQLASCPDVDAVYVASPNAAHVAQALELASAGKHLLVEKPLCANRYDAQRLFAAAELHGVVVMEAMRPLHDPAWRAIAAALPSIGRLRRATLHFGRYSSRFDELKAGRQTNIFDVRMASGALMDMGVYTVEPMVALFGMPERVTAATTLVAEKGNELTGGAIDGAGSVLCAYGEDSGTPGLVVELSYSKITTDLLPSQFEGDLGTVTVDSPSIPQSASVLHRGRAVRGDARAVATSVGDRHERLDVRPCANSMVYELRDFVRLVRDEPLDTLWGPALDARGAQASFRDVTLDALAVTDEIRRQAGIEFPADVPAEA